jgi:hypothetical protein
MRLRHCPLCQYESVLPDRVEGYCPNDNLPLEDGPRTGPFVGRPVRHDLVAVRDEIALLRERLKELYPVRRELMQAYRDDGHSTGQVAIAAGVAKAYVAKVTKRREEHVVNEAERLGRALLDLNNPTRST